MKHYAIIFLILLSVLGFAQTGINSQKDPVQLIPTDFPANDYVITAYNIKNFGVDGKSKKDVTNEFNQAIKTISEKGGGTLWVPAGHYRFNGPIKLLQGVAIRGEWKKPEAGKHPPELFLKYMQAKDSLMESHLLLWGK